jgi:protein-S-isoprenylcysteine O-methyltransferase Ste14
VSAPAAGADDAVLAAIPSVLKYASLLAFVVLVLVLVALGFTHTLLAVEPIGAAVQVLAVLLMLWARLTFGVRSLHATADSTSGGLVTTGPYHLIRHPIYASILYFMAVGIVSHPSWKTLALGVVAVIASAVRILGEEHLVVQRYPQYAAYAARTKRIVPFVL